MRHAGANIASFLPTGLWHAGAVVALVGQVPVSNWVMAMLMLLILTLTLILGPNRHKLRAHVLAEFLNRLHQGEVSK